ncbi:Uncharacterised protein at_DN0497 [Pycnogonum litorale]
MLVASVSVCLLIQFVMTHGEFARNTRECNENFYGDRHIRTSACRPYCDEHGFEIYCYDRNISRIYEYIDYISDRKIKLQNVFISSYVVKRLRQNLLRNVRTDSLYLTVPNLMEIDNVVFDNQSGLLSLTLISCRLSNIPVTTLRIMEQLEAFTLHRSSKLVSITDYDFKDMRFSNHLWLLDLSHNKINYIGKRAFTDLTALRVLHLEYNNIKKFDPESLPRYNRLVKMHLEHNELIEIPMIMMSKKLYFIPTLNLSSNYITKFSRAASQVLMMNHMNVVLRDNPFHCDCKLIHVILSLRRFKHDKYLLGDIRCASPFNLFDESLGSLVASNCQEFSVKQSVNGSSNETTILTVYSVCVYLLLQLLPCSF